ncbi:kinase-like domain-containing protein, partial [Flagelloscypha sp. PMI_526]
AFLDEAIIWRHLRHPNVLPFLGINQTLFPGRTCFISPYMVHGDLNKFLRRNPDHDRVSALHQVSQGLQYLHATYICHGDVKGANILVDEHLHCSLADFGITSLISTHTATADLATATRSTKGSLRWMAPEILSLDEDITGIRAAPRDVYAFGCTIIEVVSGKPPFPELNDARAMLAVLTGKRPARPSADCMTDELWQLVEQCWDQEPDRRPSCEEIIKAFERIRHR